MIIGLTKTGEEFCKTDAEILTKFCHRIDDIEYMYDINIGKNVTMEVVGSRHKIGGVKLRADASSAMKGVGIDATQRQRVGNTRVFWSLDDLYTLLRLDQYTYASKWVSATFAQWDKWIL